jgi:hypothetical protein
MYGLVGYVARQPGVSFITYAHFRLTVNMASNMATDGIQCATPVASYCSIVTAAPIQVDMGGETGPFLGSYQPRFLQCGRV